MLNIVAFSVLILVNKTCLQNAMNKTTDIRKNTVYFQTLSKYGLNIKLQSYKTK